MRQAFSFLLAGLLPAAVFAQTSASITMEGSAHIAAIDQQGENLGVTASIRQSGNGNIAGSTAPDGPYPLARPYGIWQLDSGNVQAAIVQAGEGGKAAAWQKYSHEANVSLAQDGGTRGSTLALTQEYVNRAQVVLLQEGGAQQAMGLAQNGSDLVASARQQGPRQHADLEQYGSLLAMNMQQEGADASAALGQYGANLRLNLRQSGAAPSAMVLQNGSGLQLDAAQAGAHKLKVTQR